MSTKMEGVNQKWTRCYLVVDENGKMKLFEDDNALKTKQWFDLTLLRTGDIVVNETLPIISVQSEEGTIQIKFESAKESEEVMEWMKRFIVVFEPRTKNGDNENDHIRTLMDIDVDVEDEKEEKTKSVPLRDENGMFWSNVFCLFRN